MHPEFIFSIFGSLYTLSSYTTFAVLAVLSVNLLAPFTLRRIGFGTGNIMTFTIILTAAFFAGARLLNYAVNPLQYGSSLQLWSWRFSGFSVYGGLIAAGLLLPFLAFVFRIRFWAAADALVMPVGIAFVIAKVGCFLNGCCAGKATNSMIGVVFPISEKEVELIDSLLWFIDKPETAAIWPTQLLELGMALLGLAALLLLFHRLKLPEGSAALMYAIWFTAARWAVLPLRALPYEQFVTEVFYPGLYGTIILACGFMLYWRNKKQKECRLIK